ncbi:MAG: InlB B-repeat-containing protein, partial [Clostridia bacterium]|nr:InlB B-repeat-containing protein [Clostridia bacterium]
GHAYVTFPNSEHYSFDKVAGDLIIKGDGSSFVLVYLKLNEYTVRFTASGAVPGMQTKTLKFGSALTLDGIEEPVKNMNTFRGWYYDEDCTDGNEVNFANLKVSGDLILYAKFVSKSYSLIFDLNVGSGANQLPTDSALLVMVNSANLYGHVVTWDTASLFNESFKFSEVGSGKYQISYDVNNVSSNKNITGIRPSAIGYTFGGWWVEGATTQTTVIRRPSASTSTEEPIVLKARWTPATYTMRFDRQDGSRVTTKTVRNMSAWGEDGTSLLPGASGAILPANPERAGYVFGGWRVTNNESNENYNSVVYDISNYTDANGNFVFNIAEFARLGVYGSAADGYNFSNLTIYAIWNSVDIVINVPYDDNPMQGGLNFVNVTNGNESVSPSETPVHIGDTISVVPEPDAGYRFVNLIINGNALAAGVTSFTVSSRNIQSGENDIGEPINFIEVIA